MKSIKLGKLKLYPVLEKYSTNQYFALSLFEKSGEPYLTLSTNLSDLRQEGNKIFIKEDNSTFSEITQELLNQGFLTDENIISFSGYNTYKLYQINQSLIILASENKEYFF